MNKIFNKNTIATMLCVLAFCVSIKNAAQTTNDPSIFLPNITPPSPEAFKFSLYGNTPVGLFTGTPNIQLPLFTFKTNNLNVPFSLNYSSSGIKVDDVNTKTGLGWNLIGGGVISRIVRNFEDDYYDDFPMKHLDITTVPEFGMQNLYFYLFGENQGKDSERDIFIFNFPNYSGKFYFDNNNKVVFLEKSDLKVELVASTGGAMYTFVITTVDGTKYYFQETEQTMLKTFGASHADPSMKTTAWYLNKIIHPKGDEIYFAYNGVKENYVQSESQQASKSYPIIQNCASGQEYNKSITFGPVYSHTSRIVGKTIKSITSNVPSSGSIEFTYEDKNLSTETEPDDVLKNIIVKNKTSAIIEKIDFNYLLTANKRIFLKDFHFLEETNKYVFDYINPETFPVRLSKSQDHWGYFNGANNLMLLPRIKGSGFEYFNYSAADREVNEIKAQTGLLNKIIYPTKGYTEFEYASNDYYGEKEIMPNVVTKEMTLESDIDQRHTNTTTTFKADFNYTAKFTGETYFANCDTGDDSGGDHYKGRVTVFCIEDNGFVPIFQISEAYSIQISLGVTTLVLSADPTLPYYFKVEQNKNYKVSLINDYNCIHSKINLEYYSGQPQTLNTNILTGGCRIKSTKDYSLQTSNPVIKRYYYSKFEQLNISSGDNFQEPYYINYSDHIDYAGVNELSCTVSDAVLNSCSISSLFEMGSNVCYQYVTVGYGNNFENGFEENEFMINKDYREHIYLGDREFRNIPWTNLGWNNGKLIKTKIAEKQGGNYIIRKDITNTYLKDASNPTLINFAIYNPSPGVFINDLQEQCPCVSINVNKLYPVKYCSAIHFHQKDANGDCIASGAMNVAYNIQHPCFGKPLNTNVGIPTITHMDVMPYKYISYFVYLSNTITNEYDKSGLHPVTTEVNYNYASANHLQLTSQSTTDSKGETLETKYYYAKDPEMANKPFVNEMIARNIIATPLDTQTYKGVTKLSEQLTVYDKSASTSDLLLPKSIYAGKFPNSFPAIPNIGNLEKKIAFDQYDDKGNIQQYTQENGMSVSIIWGCNKTQPIAKIENATYAEVSSYVNALQTASDNGTLSESSFSGLRSNLSNAMITTYTYKPLIGISSITDPKGETVYYEYDEFNRLKFVKDAQGNLLSENQYHYKN